MVPATVFLMFCLNTLNMSLRSLPLFFVLTRVTKSNGWISRSGFKAHGVIFLQNFSKMLPLPPPPTSPQVEKILPSHWIFPTPILFLNGRGTWRAFKITNLKVNFSILMKRDQIHLRSELCPILCALAIEMFTQRPFRDFSASLLHFDRVIFVIDVYCNFI